MIIYIAATTICLCFCDRPLVCSLATFLPPYLLPKSQQYLDKSIHCRDDKRPAKCSSPFVTKPYQVVTSNNPVMPRYSSNMLLVLIPLMVILEAAHDFFLPCCGDVKCTPNLSNNNVYVHICSTHSSFSIHAQKFMHQ